MYFHQEGEVGSLEQDYSYISDDPVGLDAASDVNVSFAAPGTDCPMPEEMTDEELVKKK